METKLKLISKVVALGLVFLQTTSVDAVTISQALGVRSDFAASLTGVDERSYDAPSFNGINPFSSFTDGNFYQLESFNGGASGSTLTFYLLAEFACFDGRNPALANRFGVLDSSKNFTTVIDSATADPISSGAIAQSSGQEYTLALQSPQNTFSSDDQQNPGLTPQLVVMQVNKPGVINLDRGTTRTDTPIAFSLLSGDLLVFMEDLVISNNNTFGGMVPSVGDLDYNDMIVVVRSAANPVPEPSSLLLLAAGSLGLLKTRRKKAR
jgi:PEP-CTERM motif